MGEVVQFTNPPWVRLTPWWPEAWEINCQVISNYLDQEVPRGEWLSVFENRWLDNLKGWRHREVYNYLQIDADRRGEHLWMLLEELNGFQYKYQPIENIRWTKKGGYA